MPVKIKVVEVYQNRETMRERKWKLGDIFECKSVRDSHGRSKRDKKEPMETGQN